MSRRPDPRATLVAYGAPLMVPPSRDMGLEEALVRGLEEGREDPSVLLSLPVVLLDNLEVLDTRKLLREARAHGLASELGMVLALTARVGNCPRLARVAAHLPKRKGRPVGFPRVRGGRWGRALAEQRTPPVVARWGFRMNQTEDDFRGFVEKHLG